MSDITALTATLKRAAQEEIMCRDASDTSDLWQDEASPENVLALVEALEASLQDSDGVAGMAEHYETTISMLKGRIAELESRTVTVKLPDEVLRLAQAPQHLSKHDQLCWMSGANWMRMEAVKLNPADGIQVIEGEGQ